MNSIQLLNVDEIKSKQIFENPDLSISPDRLAFIIYTSGTTGRPKGVTQNHRNILHMVMNDTNSLGICLEDREISLTSPAGIGAIWIILRTLLNGAAVFPFEIKAEGIGKLTEWLITEKITILNALAILRQFSTILTENHKFPDIRLVGIGGDTVYKKDIELYNRHFSQASILFIGLGTTETGNLVQYFIDQETEITGDIVPVGYQSPGMEIILSDDSGKKPGGDCTGEILVKSRYLSPGYWRMSELSKAKFLRDPEGGDKRIYFTGDIGCIRPDGCLFHLGRKDFQVKVRGYRVEIVEVVNALLGLENIKEAVVIDREDSIGEKTLIAYLVCDTQSAPSVSSLRRALLQKLADYMIPSAFVILDVFPLTPNGKVDRRALPPPSRSRPKLEDPYVAPRNKIEQALVEIWQKVLGIRKIGVRDDYFDLGGSSLLAARIFAEMDNRFHKTIPLATLLSAPTVEKLAQIIADENWEASWSPLIALRTEGAKVPFFCVHAAGGNVLMYRDLAHHLGPDQPFYGLQSRGLDGEQPFDTRIEEMASRYIKEIQKVQTEEGPYLLGGYCLGGTIALEMAQQLCVQGKKVGLLALFETYNWGSLPPKSFSDNLYYYLQKIEFHWRNLLIAKDRIRFLHEKIKVANSRRAVWYEMMKSMLINRSHPNKNGQKKSIYELWINNDQAAINYKPRKYPELITHFRPIKQYARLDSPEAGWEGLTAAGVETHTLPVYPAGMMVEPFVKILATQLKACIENAQVM
jgi:thioesterase domain-containing protein/non-ribosomal peptide synthetase component E (peptide arylation enzyme)/acyl carrier protein